MDNKIKELFLNELDRLCQEYKYRIHQMPDWKLDNLLSSKDLIKNSGDNGDKINFLMDRYKKKDPIYQLLKNDLNLIEATNNNLDIKKLKLYQTDYRYLESMGLNEIQIKNFYSFADKIINQFKS